MNALLLLLSLASGDADQARPLDIAALTVGQARKWDGAIVEIVCVVGMIVVPDEGTTTIGVTEDETLSRTVVLKGEWHCFEVGDKVRAWGRLRVIRHAETVVNEIRVPGWTEIRVEQSHDRDKNRR